MEHGLAVSASDEHSIQGDEVHVWIQFEVGGRPLHDGHGAALAMVGAFDFHAAAIPSKHRVDEDVETEIPLTAGPRTQSRPWHPPNPAGGCAKGC